MGIPVVIRLLGVFLLIISGFLLLPLVLGLLLGEYSMVPGFAVPILGGILFFGFSVLIQHLSMNNTTKGRGSQTILKRSKGNLTIRGGFLFVSLAWLSASALGSLPYYISGFIPSFSYSFFETMSGFTTTGASILSNIEALPRSLLFWRSLTHWLGGMGIVVLTVALFPLLGVGGFHLVKAEAPGPTVDRITPRITETAKILWFIYLGFTIIQTILLYLGGMDLIDSLIHTFGTLATGGFSSNNASIGGYNSGYIHGVITFFMVVAGINFTLYHRLFLGSFSSLRANSELKAYLGIFCFASLVIVADLLGHGVYTTLKEAVQYGTFQAASIMTTTGYATTDYDQWPTISRSILFLLMFVGGSAGSTGGGIKVLRLVILFKIGSLHLKKLLEPRGIFIPRINQRPLEKDSLEAVGGFIFLYISILIGLTVAVSIAGYDLLSSFATALAILGNIGPGFGAVGPTMNYSGFPHWLTWILSLGMMLGRLELYTVLVILTPMFWKRH